MKTPRFAHVVRLVGLALIGVIGVPLAAQEPVAVVAKPRNAHAEAAKKWRQEAEDWESKAAQHDRKAASVPKNATLAKWPALTPRWVADEKTEAGKARDAAREARRMADWHARQAVESSAPEVKAVE